MMPEEETCFCCLRISQQKRRAEDIWLEAGTTAWVRSSRGVSRCCTDKKVPQVCWLPGSDHSMASNLIKFFYCKYGGLSDSLPCLPSNVVSTMPFLGLLRQYIFFIFICYNSVIKTKAGMEQHSCEHSLVLYVLGRRHFP